MKSVPKWRSTEGSLSLPLLLAIFTLTMSGFGVWGILRHWRFLVETQLRLNECVGVRSQDFKQTLISLASDNRKIRVLRGAIQLATLRPDLIPPLEVALNSVVAKQELSRFQWKAKQAQWLLKQGCGHRGDKAYPLPDLQFTRDPPDTTGPQAIHWMGEMPSQFLIQLSHSPRHAAAVIQRKQQGQENVSLENGGGFGKSFEQVDWTAAWDVPRMHKWTSFY